MSARYLGIAVLMLILLQNSFTQEKLPPIRSRAEMSQAVEQIQSDLATLNQHHEKYRQAAEKLSGMYAELSKKSEAVGKAAGAVQSSPGNSNAEAQLLSATKQMQKTQMSFNLQYLQLQSQMQQENQQYTAVSNILKTKHDTVKNSIANIK